MLNPRLARDPRLIPAPIAMRQSRFSFGTEDDALNPKSQLPNPQSPLLWGAAAEKRRRKRKTTESASRTAAQKKADRLNEAERQRKIRNYLQGQATLKAQEEAARKEGDDPYAGMEDWYEKQDRINAEMLGDVPELQRWAEKQKAIKAQKDAEMDSATRSYMAMGATLASGEFSQDGYHGARKPLEEKSWWESVLEYQYTPVIAGAISVLATDAAFILLTVSASPTAPATLAGVGICWGIGRIASLVGATSTGYQYKHQLYGTTKLDVEITLATYGLSFIPKPDMAVMNHIGFLYSCYTTFVR